MADIWTLYEQNYGRVPSERLDDLKLLERKHSAVQLEEAFGKARDANDGEGAPFGYVQTCLAKMSVAAPGQTRPKRLLCEGCGMPTYIDNMLLRARMGTDCGVCSDCARRPDLWPDDPFEPLGISPTAKLVEAYWGSVTA